jgi:hypothetical protein
MKDEKQYRISSWRMKKRVFTKLGEPPEDGGQGPGAGVTREP